MVLNCRVNEILTRQQGLTPDEQDMLDSLTAAGDSETDTVDDTTEETSEESDSEETE